MDEAKNPYHVNLEVYEGPLDLLLHLIKEQRVDIWNIPVAEITEQYLSHIEMMRSLNLDVAGEFILMASTLAHIKSQLLLPPDPSQDDLEDEGRDPRAELVRRLLEYQKYKTAADELYARNLLGRDVFVRQKRMRSALPQKKASELIEVSIFKLVEAFHKLLENVPLDQAHEVARITMTIHECTQSITKAISVSAEGTIRFSELFKDQKRKEEVVTTFLALLEMVKMGVLRIFQADTFSEISLMGTPLLYGEWSYHGDEYNGQPSPDVSH